MCVHVDVYISAERELVHCNISAVYFTVQMQSKTKKPEMLVIAGCLRGLSGLLTNFEQIPLSASGGQSLCGHVCVCVGVEVLVCALLICMITCVVLLYYICTYVHALIQWIGLVRSMCLIHHAQHIIMPYSDVVCTYTAMCCATMCAASSYTEDIYRFTRMAIDPEVRACVRHV